MMFIAAREHMEALFFVAELFNAFSLVLTQNGYNAYLLDAHFKDSKNKNFDLIMGSFAQYSFLGVSISAMIGALCYQYIGIYSAIISALMLVMVMLVSLIYLPSQIVSKPSVAQVSKKQVKLIYRKILTNKNLYASLLITSVFYQVIIQYWQVLLEQNRLKVQVIMVLSLVLHSF